MDHLYALFEDWNNAHQELLMLPYSSKENCQHISLATDEQKNTKQISVCMIWPILFTVNLIQSGDTVHLFDPTPSFPTLSLSKRLASKYEIWSANRT